MIGHRLYVNVLILLTRQFECVYFYFVRIIKLYKKTTKKQHILSVIGRCGVSGQQSLAEGQEGVGLSASREFQN